MSLNIGALPNSHWQRLTPLLNALGWNPDDAPDPEVWYQSSEFAYGSNDDVYVLFFVCPEQAVSNAMQEQQDLVTAIASWSDSAVNMLEFRKSNPERAILVDATEAYRKPKKFLDKAAEKLGLPPVEIIPKLTEQDDSQGIFLMLASQLVDQSPELRELRDEFVNSSIFLGSHHRLSPALDIGKLYEEQLAQRKVVEEKEMQVRALSEENEMALKQLFRLQESLEVKLLAQGKKEPSNRQRSSSKTRERTLLDKLAAKIKSSRFLWQASGPVRALTRPFRRALSRRVGLGVALSRATKELADMKPRYQAQKKRITELENERKSLLREFEACQAELSGLRSESTSLRESIERLEGLLNHAEKLNGAEREYVKSVEYSFDREKSALNEQISSLGKENGALNEQISSLRKENSALKEEVSSLRAKVDELRRGESSLDLLESRLSSLITKGLVNNFMQIESYIAVQHYLIHGELAMDFHGWPISPDIASYLIGKFERRNYDLIVEFGSGTSTQLFARVIQNSSQALKKKARMVELAEVATGGDCGEEEVAPSKAARVISFEHNELYYDRTKKELERKGLDSFVHLVHAPLVDYQYPQGNFRYYSCDKSLKNASQAVGAGARVMVLVDGPPSDLGPLSRFPALPKLLSHFSNCAIDIILDDFNRPEEKAVVAEWKKLLDERNIAYCEEKPKVEKGAICLSVIN
ncbi:hypothetical protein [Microbulbifer sp. HZ11]|uniref:hypothetical protein n=1 Tax=Microbulbifer sp. HZ11 TaxID=1453501 RepID=UPI0005BE3C4D|nr:hypothetical protein [Microbulbifer sp. HZ11]